MKITEIRIRRIDLSDSKLKAVASITLDDCFVIHDIRIVEGKDNMLVAMPSRREKDGKYRDIAHPLNTEFRVAISNALLDAYNNSADVPKQ